MRNGTQDVLNGLDDLMDENLSEIKLLILVL